MGTFIIAAALIGLFSYVFQLFWKAVLKFFFYILKKSIELLKKVVTFVKKGCKAVAYLYRRYRNGKITRVKYEEEEIDEEFLPEGVREQFKQYDEVVVKDTDIEPEEFE